MKIENKDYFLNPALNFSVIKELLKTPKHFWEAFENSKEPTKSMELGTAVHCALLESEKFKNEYVAEPGLDRRTKEYKKWLDENKDKTPYDAIVVGGILKAVSEASQYSESVKMILENKTTNEESFFFEDRGLQLKCKIDAFSEKEKTLIDIKTTNDVDPYKFSKQIFDRAYHIQLAHYGFALEKQGINIEKYRIVGISTTEPYDVVEFEIPLEVIEKAREELFNLYEKAHQTILFNDRGGYCKSVIRVDYPTYYREFK